MNRLASFAFLAILSALSLMIEVSVSWSAVLSSDSVNTSSSNQVPVVPVSTATTTTPVSTATSTPSADTTSNEAKSGFSFTSMSLGQQSALSSTGTTTVATEPALETTEDTSSDPASPFGSYNPNKAKKDGFRLGQMTSGSSTV
jgi:hypothetical protein